MVINLKRGAVLKDFLIGGLLFLFIYNIPFSFLPMATAKLVLLFAVVFLLFNSKERYVRNILSHNIMAPFLLVLLLIGYSLLSNIYNHTTDFTFAYTYFLFLIEYLVGSVVIVALIV